MSFKSELEKATGCKIAMQNVRENCQINAIKGREWVEVNIKIQTLIDNDVEHCVKLCAQGIAMELEDLKK